MEYKRLGDYIRPVDVRNRELKVKNLLGLSMSKKFRPSTSNIVGVDLSIYKVVNKNVFAFDPMSVIRVHKVPIALNDSEIPIIVSPAYFTFECKDSNELYPRYLMMWFQRTEFDRYADFKSDSAIRGGYNWDELCDTIIHVPSIDRQREIVSEYETLSNRIRLNEQMIANLEETAQALYRKMFVDGVDKENLPEGWRRLSIFDITKVIYGYPFDSELFCNDNRFTPIIRIRDILENKTDTYTTEKTDIKYQINDGDILIGMDGVFHMTIWSGGYAYQNQRIVRVIPNAEEFISSYQIYFAIFNPIKELETSIEGTTVAHLSDKDMKKLSVIIATKDIQENAYSQFETIYRNVIVYKKENLKLTELQSLLLARMGK